MDSLWEGLLCRERSGTERVKEQELCFLHTMKEQLSATSLLSQHLVPLVGGDPRSVGEALAVLLQGVSDSAVPHFAEREQQTLVLATGLFQSEFQL